MAEDKAPLPQRPTPHERDGRTGGDSGGRPHPRYTDLSTTAAIGGVSR